MRRPVWTFVIAALIFGTLYAVIVPPFSAPDEPSHFARSWNTSRGHVFARREGAEVGYFVPREVASLESRFPIPNLDVRRIVTALHEPPPGPDTVFRPYSGHAVAPVILYMAQGAGIALARGAGGSPLLSFYFGRFFNLIAGIVLIAFAIRMIPSYRWLMTLIALTPMANYIRGSMSGDVVTLGIAFLFTAVVARALFVEEPVTAARWTAITLLAACLCLTKVVYIPMAMLPLVVPQRRFSSAAAAWRARAILAAASLAAAAVASRIATYFWAPFRAGVTTPGAQVHFILTHPQTFATILFDEYVLRAKWYLISMVGDLGAGDFTVVLPKILVVFYFGCLIALIVIDTSARLRILPLQRIWFAFLCAGTAFAIAFAIYTTWNPVGWPRIDGLQGRYYLPLLPAAAFAVHRVSDGIAERWRMAITVTAVVLANAVAIHLIVTGWLAGGWRAFGAAF